METLFSLWFIGAMVVLGMAMNDESFDDCSVVGKIGFAFLLITLWPFFLGMYISKWR